MKTLNYIESEPNRSKVRLTSKGMEVKELGGHKAYQEIKLRKRQDEENFYSSINAVTNELTKLGVTTTIIAEYFFNKNEEKSKSGFMKFFSDKGVDLGIALYSPAIAKFLTDLP